MWIGFEIGHHIISLNFSFDFWISYLLIKSYMIKLMFCYPSQDQYECAVCDMADCCAMCKQQTGDVQ